MNQNNNNIKHYDKTLSDDDYDPAKDPEVDPDTIIECITQWRNNLPYNKKRYIMIAGFTILVILVVYLGYARGALDVCNDLGGKLEVGWKIECRPSQYNTQTPLIDNTFIVPNLTIEDVD